MKRTVYFVGASVDGYIADADGRLDWLMQFDKAEGVPQQFESFMAGIGPVAMGADTYEFLLREMPTAWPYSGRPSWVFTHRKLRGYDGADIRFTEADVRSVHREMIDAAGEKDIWLVGGGKLVAQFARAGLLDEIRLTIVPVVLGNGIPLLPAPLREPLELSAVNRIGPGLVELRYDVRPRGSSTP